MLRSSEEPDTPTRAVNRENVKKFMQTVLADNIQMKQLTNYMWESRVAQVQQARRKSSARTQIQKGGVVYAGDIDRDITTLKNPTFEANLSTDQRIYLLALRSTVLPQLILRTKALREVAERSAVNCQRRATRALNKKRKHEEIEEKTVQVIEE